MNQKEKRKIENMLLVEGLAPLTDPDLIEQMAHLVSNWPGDKHDYMRDLLSECDADKRSEMYSAIAPKLRFRALSLSQYEAQIALKAGEMVSQGRMQVVGDRPKPIVIGEEKFVAVPKQHATNAIATVRCHRCPKSDQFVEKTPAAAMIAARKAGWTREAGVNKECCPECSVALAAALEPTEIIQMGGVSISRSSRLPVHDRRRVN